MLSSNKLAAVINGVLTALFLVGVIVCFVLLVDKRAANPEKICTMKRVNCYDRIVDRQAVAVFVVNVTINGCVNSEFVEMFAEYRNCERINHDGSVWYNEKGYKMGSNVCNTRRDDTCAWDHGDFIRYTDTPLLAAGIAIACCCAVTFITMSVFLCCICNHNNCDRRWL
jgi:hypothetical protein